MSNLQTYYFKLDFQKRANIQGASCVMVIVKNDNKMMPTIIFICYSHQTLFDIRDLSSF